MRIFSLPGAVLASWVFGASIAFASPTSSPADGPSSTVLQACAASLNGQPPSPTPSDWNWNGVVRRYYVAAEEVEWNYAPTGWDNWLGVPLNVSPRAELSGALQYGTTWLKALYRGYTDSTFSAYSAQPPWQGTQGPTLRAEVGDLIEIMFVNKLPTYYATMHSMGLAYTKRSEGADYPNNTAPGENVVLPLADAVPPVDGVGPGDCVVYKWMVNTPSGPRPGEPAKVHSYHSYVALQQDANAGLIGPSIVYAPGQMNSTMANYREIPLLYMIYEEGWSWLSGANAQRLGQGNKQKRSPSAQYYNHGSGSGGSPQASGSHEGSGYNGGFGGGSGGPPQESGSQGESGYSSGFGGPPQTSATQAKSEYTSTTSIPPAATGTQGYGAEYEGSPFHGIENIDTQNLWSGNKTVWQPQVINLAGAGKFTEAPSFFTLNGYIFSNNPTFEMCHNDNVIWYVNAYGSASHVFHLHGHSVGYEGDTHPAISINDGVGKTLYMNATEPGLWQAICHVDYHQTLGMVSNYRVYRAGQCPLPPLGGAAGAD